jgi:hypothetical protein
VLSIELTTANKLTVSRIDRDHVSIQETPTALDTEFARLAEIKTEMATAYARLRKQEHTIIHMLKQDFKQCDGIQCMLQMAMQNAPDFAHLIAEHFSHEKVKLKKNLDEIPMVGTLGFSESPPRPVDDVGSKKENPARPASPPFDAKHPPHHPSEDEHTHPPFEGEHPRPPFRGDHPPPFHGEHGPPPPHHEGPPPHHPGDHPPPPHHGDEPHGPPRHHGHGRPSFIHYVRHERFRIMKAALALLAGSFLLSLLFKAVQKCCRDPRRRADRASRREERRARCEYRRAAHRYRILSWWATHKPRRRSAVASTDYEEKRTLILQQEGVLEAAMQNEIRDLEIAAELEEGRGSPQVVSQARAELPGEPSYSRHDGHGFQPVSDYSAPPPQYEAELDDDMMVVNGFGYTPSNTNSTPARSVVDFYPRMSTETLSTNVTRSDCMD